MKKNALFFKKHSSIILTSISCIGVISTAILSAKATIKAMNIIEIEKNKLDHIMSNNEKIKIGIKYFIPPFLCASSTILCICGVHFVNRNTQKSLMSAYLLMTSKVKDYQNKLNKLSEKYSHNFEHDIIRSKIDNIELTDDNLLFFDYNSMRYFQSSFECINRAEYILNSKVYADGYACLNDFYDLIGLPHVPYGYQMGWSTLDSDRMYSENGLKVNYELATFDDGLECNIITISYPPSWEYFC